MAGIFVANTTKCTVGSTQVEGLLEVRETLAVINKVKLGDGAQETFDPVAESLRLSLTFSSAEAALQFKAAAPANLIIRVKKFGAVTLRDYTYKNVKLAGGGGNVPTAQAAGIAGNTVEAVAEYGSSDTYATMKTGADVT